MDTEGWTSFCRNGHIVDVCPPGAFLFQARRKCQYCGAEVVGHVPGWRVTDFTTVTVIPLRLEKIRYKNSAAELIETEEPVYDVERFKLFADK